MHKSARACPSMVQLLQAAGARASTPPPRSRLVRQASQAARELEAARGEVAQIRQQQEAERGRVKKAIAEMRRKMDG